MVPQSQLGLVDRMLDIALSAYRVYHFVVLAYCLEAIDIETHNALATHIGIGSSNNC